MNASCFEAAVHQRRILGRLIEPKTRVIRLRISHDPGMMLYTLQHEMAHAASNGWHGPKWQAEMKRLDALDALYFDDVVHGGEDLGPSDVSTPST
jgi:hypothetical protein